MISLRHLRRLSGTPLARVTHPSCATTTPLWGVGVERRRGTARSLGDAKVERLGGLNVVGGRKKEQNR